MEEWKTYKLGNLCKNVCSGGTPKSTSSEYYGGDIPWLNTKEVNFNRIYSTESFITQAGLDNSSAKWIAENAVIVAMYGNTAGKVALSKIPLTTNQACCNLTIDESKADYRYIYYYLASQYIYIKSMANGAAQQNLNSQQIKDIEIPLPSLCDQHQIADILSSIDDKIELNNRINHNLEEQAQALYKSWFVDFEPFKDGEFVESELGNIPKGWQWGTLYDIATIEMGQSPSGTSFNEEGKGIVFYQGRTEFGDRFPSIRLFTTEPTRFAEQFSVLLSVRAPVGDINVAKERCCIGRGLASISGKFQSFVFYTVASLRPVMERYNGEGTVFGSINRKDLENLQVVIPTFEAKEQFNKIAEVLDADIYDRSMENIRLTKLRDSLLPNLMSGKLNINEIDC